MTDRPRVASEFSRPVAVEDIGNAPARRVVSANDIERRRLAERFGLLALDRLSAELELRRRAGDVIRVAGHLAADVVQSCVVTLEPVPAHVETEVACSFGPGLPDDADLDPLAEEIEPIEDGRIDLGEVVAQQLAVALDPYPRAPGAALPASEAEEASAPPERRENPFAKLEKLKKN